MSIGSIIHFTSMALALILIIIAINTARKKDGTEWLKKHRLFAILGVASALCGGTAMYLYKESMSYPHLASPHAVAGLVTLILLVDTPIAGMLLAGGKQKIRPFHRYGGMVTAVLMGITAVFGVLMLLSLMKII